MLQYEQALRFQESVFEDQVRKFGQVRQCIRGIGEDKVELLLAAGKVFEYVRTNREATVRFHCLHYFLDESMVLPVFFYRYHPAASPAYQFDADTARTGEEVEGGEAFFLKIQVALQHVEKVFLGKVGGGACLKVVGNVEPATFIDSADYSHR